MAIVVEGTPTKYESASTASAVIPYPTGITAGELLVAVVGTSTVTAPTTVPSGWTLTKAQNGDNAISVSMWHKVASGSESGTESFGTTSGRTTGHMFRLSGVDTTTPVDATAVGAGVPIQTTFTMPTITTATNGAMLIHGIVLNASNRDTNDISTLSGTTLVGITGPSGTLGGRITGTYSETRATAGATGTRVWSKTGATALQWAGITAAFRPGSSGPAVPVLNRCVQGIPGTTSHTIKVNTTNASSVRIKAGTNSAVTTGVVYGGAVTPDGEGNSELTITGLTANTPYFYRIALTDSGATETLDTWTDVGQFKTSATGQQTFTFAFGSCTNNTDSASLGAIAVKKPDLFFHLGDEYYADASGTSVANFRTKMGDKLTVTNHKAVYRTSGATWLPSDHDGMNNNGNYAADATAWTNWNQVYREMKPTNGLPGGGMGVYRTFTYGRVRFIAIDRRSFAVAAGNTDNSSKTCLGTTQKQWFKDQIDAATEPVIVVINSDPWIITTDAGDDGWGGYITERDELAAYIDASNKNVVMLAGDMHAVAAEDGSGSPGGVPVFQAAPFYQNASIKGGPYDVGPYPASGTAVVQQYGWMDVTDSGTQISLVYKGFSSDNTQRVTLTKTYDVPQTATVSAVAATATATDIVPVVTGAATVVHIKASATSQEGTPVVSGASTVVGVRAQGSSTAIAPAVTTIGAVAGVRAQASSTAIAPAVSAAATGTVTAVVATATSTGYAPAVTTLGAVAAVAATATSLARVPAVSNGGGNTYNLFTGTPQLEADLDSVSVNLGTEFYVTATAWVTHVRFLMPATGTLDSGSRVATIYSTANGITGTAVAGPFTIPAPSAGQWGTYQLPTPFQLTANTRYRIAIRHPNGRYSATGGYFASGAGNPTATQGILVVPSKADALATRQGSYTYDAGNVFPASEFGGASYYSDVTITDTDPSSGGVSTAAPRAQGSSTAIAPAVGGGFTVFAITSTGSAVAVPPVWSGGATVTAVASTATATDIAPSVSGAQTITAVRAQGSSAAIAPSLVHGHVLAAPAATATATAPIPTVGGGITVSAVTATATAADYAPVVTSGVQVVGVDATATASASAPAVTSGAEVAAQDATATATDYAPAVSAGVVLTSVTATISGDMIDPTVSVIAGAVVASPTLLATALARVPVVTAQGVGTVSAVTATASATAPAPVFSSATSVGAPAMGATTSTPEPSVGSAAVIQSVPASASAQATPPAFAIVATILALRMIATATDRTPSVSAASVANAVVALATAVAHTPHLGGSQELYLKDGTRLIPYMLIGGILVPVDPQF